VVPAAGQRDARAGPAALFFVISGGADPDRAIDALQPLGPRVLRTTLDPAVEQRLLAAFTEPAPPLDEAGDGGR
jgi:uncharacterized membrane protein